LAAGGIINFSSEMKEQPKIHSGHIEITVAKLFDYRRNIIVPNVSWGWHLSYEADMVMVNANNYATEIEVKISISDLKKDFKKRKHLQPSKVFKFMYYAIPVEMMEKAKEIIPEKYGIITVKWNGYKYVATRYRGAKVNRWAGVVSNQHLINLMRLAAMRIYTLKEHNSYKTP
jgi:hypothetical protein